MNSSSCLDVYSDHPDEFIDIPKMYNIVLLLLFIGNCLTIVSGIIRMIGKNKISNFFAYGGFVTFAGFIMLHIYRFNVAGKFCSGDYSKDTKADAPLWSKGNYLFGYMVYIWVMIGIGCTCCLCMTGFYCVKALRED